GPCATVVTREYPGQSAGPSAQTLISPRFAGLRRPQADPSISHTNGSPADRHGFRLKPALQGEVAPRDRTHAQTAPPHPPPTPVRTEQGQVDQIGGAARMSGSSCPAGRGSPGVS